MSNDGTTEGDELSLTVIPEAESDGDAQGGQSAEGESADISVELDEEDAKADKQLSPAEESARLQLEANLAKVLSGKIKVEDAPEWMRPKLNARLESVGNAPKTEDLVKQAMAKERKSLEFQDLQRQIPPLTKSEAKELKERYDRLKGADNVAALQTVLDAMGLSQKIKEAEKRGIAKGKIALPRSGQPAVRKSEETIGNVPVDVIHDEKKWAQMIRGGNVE